MADAAIIEFINTNLSLKDERTTGDTYEEIIKQSINANDSSTQEQTQNITNIIDKVNSKIKASASGKFVVFVLLKNGAIQVKMVLNM